MQYVSVIYIVVHVFSIFRPYSERTHCIRSTEGLNTPDPSLKGVCLLCL